MFVHFRENFEQLQQAELALREAPAVGLPRADDIVSVRGRTRTVRVDAEGLCSLAERGIEPFSDAWNTEIAETLNASGKR